MKWRVERKWKTEKYTIGRLYIDDKFLCNTMEPIDRGLSSGMKLVDIKKIKVAKQTAIPTGEYKVELYLSPRFKRRLPIIKGVKGFSGVLFHRGNKVADTAGCILPGENKQKGMVLNSTYYEKYLVDLLEKEKEVELKIE